LRTGAINSDTPAESDIKVRLNGETVSIDTVAKLIDRRRLRAAENGLPRRA
jgi:hypothetical protein